MGIEQFLLHRAETKGEKKGERKGEKRGDEKRLLDVIRNARLNGLNLDMIANIVNLPVEQVRTILDKIGIE